MTHKPSHKNIHALEALIASVLHVVTVRALLAVCAVSFLEVVTRLKTLKSTRTVVVLGSKVLWIIVVVVEARDAASRRRRATIFPLSR